MATSNIGRENNNPSTEIPSIEGLQKQLDDYKTRYKFERRVAIITQRELTQLKAKYAAEVRAMIDRIEHLENCLEKANDVLDEVDSVNGDLFDGWLSRLRCALQYQKH